jgi:hypothetical protein
MMKPIYVILSPRAYHAGTLDLARLALIQVFAWRLVRTSNLLSDSSLETFTF